MDLASVINLIVEMTLPALGFQCASMRRMLNRFEGKVQVRSKLFLEVFRLRNIIGGHRWLRLVREENSRPSWVAKIKVSSLNYGLLSMRT